MERAKGIDTNQWRVGERLYKAAKKQDYTFSIPRASVRISRDPGYIPNRKRSREYEMITGAFHFLYWFPEPEKQARVFYDALVESGGINDELPPALDLEDDRNDKKHEGVKRWLKEADVLRFICEFEKLYNDRKLMIYTSAYWWNKRIGNVPWASEYPLWVADHRKPRAEPAVPKPWKDKGWDIWQYQVARIEGYPFTVDQNVYKGTLDELKAAYPAPRH